MNPYYEISTIHPFFSSFGLYDYESIQVNISFLKEDIYENAIYGPGIYRVELCEKIG